MDTTMTAAATPASETSATPKHISDIVFVLVTAAYIGYEIRWNSSLLSAIGDASLGREAIQGIVDEGRVLAAFGLTWALARGLITASFKPVPLAINIGLFAGLVAFSYAAIGQLYDTVVRAIPAQESTTLYQLAVHRAGAVGGAGDPAYIKAASDPLVRISWPLLLTDAQAMASVSFGYESARQQAVTSPLTKVSEALPRIATAQRQAAQIKSAAANADAAFEKGYSDYVAISHQIATSLTSKMFSGVLQDRIQTFKAATCGMAPSQTPNPTREQFAGELKHSCYQDRQQLGAWYLAGKPDPEQSMRAAVIYSDAGVSITMGDVIGMDEAQLKAFVTTKAQAVTNDRLPTAENIKASEKNVTVIASVLLPPVALLLSLVSILANAGALAGGLIHRFLAPVGAVLAVALAITLVPAKAFSDPVFGVIETRLQADYGFPMKAVSRLITIERMLP